MFQNAIDKNRMVVTPKVILIEAFYEGIMYNGHVKVASLVYIYVYVGSKTIFFPVITTFFAKLLHTFNISITN